MDIKLLEFIRDFINPKSRIGPAAEFIEDEDFNIDRSEERRVGKEC